MSSIEDLIALPEFIDTPEAKSARKKAKAEFDMQFFDLLPKSIRDFINNSEVPFEGYTAAVLYKQCGNEADTIKEMRRRIDDYKRRNFRAI